MLHLYNLLSINITTEITHFSFSNLYYNDYASSIEYFFRFDLQTRYYSYFCKISLTSSGPEGEPSTLPSGVIIR